MPDSWNGFLLSDRDERNEIVGAARDGPSPFWLVLGFLLVAKSKYTLLRRTIVQEVMPKVNLPPT